MLYAVVLLRYIISQYIISYYVMSSAYSLKARQAGAKSEAKPLEGFSPVSQGVFTGVSCLLLVSIGVHRFSPIFRFAPGFVALVRWAPIHCRCCRRC